jgi:hypothetical protein
MPTLQLLQPHIDRGGQCPPTDLTFMYEQELQ